MSLAPPCTRPGDEVYVLHGGNIPFIVRSIGKKLREEGSVYGVLVRDCFLDESTTILCLAKHLSLLTGLRGRSFFVDSTAAEAFDVRYLSSQQFTDGY